MAEFEGRMPESEAWSVAGCWMSSAAVVFLVLLFRLTLQPFNITATLFTLNVTPVSLQPSLVSDSGVGSNRILLTATKAV